MQAADPPRGPGESAVSTLPAISPRPPAGAADGRLAPAERPAPLESAAVSGSREPADTRAALAALDQRMVGLERGLRDVLAALSRAPPAAAARAPDFEPLTPRRTRSAQRLRAIDAAAAAEPPEVAEKARPRLTVEVERKTATDDEADDLGAALRRGVKRDTLNGGRKAEDSAKADLSRAAGGSGGGGGGGGDPLGRTKSRRRGSLIQMRSVAAVGAAAMALSRRAAMRRTPSSRTVSAAPPVAGAGSPRPFPGNTPRGMKLASLTLPADQSAELAKAMRLREQSRWMLRHDSVARAAWDMVVVGLVMYVLLEVPFSSAFDSAFFEGEGSWLKFAVDALFFVDLVLNFRTTYVDRDTAETVVEPRRVAVHYLRTWFVVDLLACFPFDMFQEAADRGSPDNGLLKVLKLLRLIRVGKIFKRLDQLMQASAFRLLRLLAFICVVIHWVSCMWFLVGDVWASRYELPGGGSLLHDAPVHEQYGVCFFTATAMLFRNTHQPPEALDESYFAAFVIVLGCCLQASVFGSVAVLLAGLDQESWEYKHHTDVVRERMRQLELPAALRDRVNSYYEQLWLRHKTLKVDADDFIQELSPALQSDVKLSMFADFVRQVPFFRAAPGGGPKVSSLVVEALVVALTTHVYLKDDVIMRKGEFGNWMGFVGPGGRLAVLDPRSHERRVIRVLGMGEYVGEMSVLLRVRRTADVVAIAWSRIFVLTRSDFVAVRQCYPDEMRVVEANIERCRQQKEYRHDEEALAKQL